MTDPSRANLVLLDPDGREVGRLTPELAELLASNPQAAVAVLALAGVDPRLVELLTAPPGPEH